MGELINTLSSQIPNFGNSYKINNTRAINENPVNNRYAEFPVTLSSG